MLLANQDGAILPSYKYNNDILCVHDKDHMSALRIREWDTNETDPRSYEVTLAVTNKAQKKF